MALDKNTLKEALKAAFVAQKNKTDNPDAALDDLAGKMADAVDAYVRGAQVFATPDQVTAATMVAGSYPVVASNNLICTLN